ncbi:hypothetical protein [Mesorhizobium sp. CAU 1732]|uniref:hypothetical protein n=1 Tax=Mesorhizobium sp. CAU 1732 TaxID=3140358 RepID=UPI00325FE5AA
MDDGQSVVLGVGQSFAMAAESPDRVDPLFDCSTPLLEAHMPEKAKLLLVQ